MRLPKRLQWIKGEAQPNPGLRLLGWAFLSLGLLQLFSGLGMIVYAVLS